MPQTPEYTVRLRTPHEHQREKETPEPLTSAGASGKGRMQADGARMPPNECGGYREGLVLSPRRDSMLALDPPVSFCFFRRGLLTSLGTRWLLRAYVCLRRGCFAKPGPREKVVSLLGGRFGPDRALLHIGAPTASTPLIRWRTVLQR